MDLPPRDFVALFKKEKIYDEIRNKLKPHERPDDAKLPHPLQRFFGCFVGFYPCRQYNDTSRNVIGFDIFNISPKQNSHVEAELLQSPLDFDDNEAYGTVRVIHDAVEIMVEYNNEKDPNTCYLASLPRSEIINSLLATCMDITYPDRLVSTCSALFVRIEKDRLPTNSEEMVIMFGQDSEVYSYLRSVFEKATNYNPATLHDIGRSNRH